MLIDTNVLVAFANIRDQYHAPASQLIETISRVTAIVIVPVLVETFQIVAARVHYAAAVDAFGSISKTFDIEPLQLSDYARMRAIMAKYRDAEFDIRGCSADGRC